jgi:hypothetical protein
VRTPGESGSPSGVSQPGLEELAGVRAPDEIGVGGEVIAFGRDASLSYKNYESETGQSGIRVPLG